MDRLKTLKRRIWITKKCRIIASERLKEKYEFYELITLYYSICVVIFSILNINDSTTSTISLLVLSSSITLSLFSLYVNSNNFQQRYFDLKFNYLKLDALLNELENVESTVNNNSSEYHDKIDSINEKYNVILSSVENHDKIDYLMFLDTPDHQERNPTSDERKLLKKHHRGNKVFKYFLYTLPLLLIIIPILNKYIDVL